MKLIRGLSALAKVQSNSIATIGNFDGIHLGHQQLLKELVQLARSKQVASSVILFEPQPAEFFLADNPPARLLRLRDKLTLLRDAGVDQVICLRFNKTLAELSANDFVKQILLDGLAIQHLIVGDDFHFGKNRLGNVELLKQYNFSVTSSPTFVVDGSRVSSSRIREALSQADLIAAKTLLGRDYFISGHVAHGDKRGRTIGFPTANIFVPMRKLALTGVYAVQVYGLAEQPLPGVANIGRRPTVDGTQPRLEVFLFNFDQSIYGRFIRVAFLYKIRDEKKFASLDALVAQIREDAGVAESYFRSPSVA